MSSLKTEAKRRGRPKKAQVYQLEKYTLCEEHPPQEDLPGRWKVSGRSLNGSYKRVRFNAANLKEAQKRAEEILLGRRSDAPLMTLAQAFNQAIATRTVEAETRARYVKFAGYFCEWAEGQRSITYWHELRFEHAHDYMRWLLHRGLAGKSVSHYLEPVRFTALWMSQAWPERYVNFTASLRIPKDAGRSFAFEDQKAPGYLTIADVCDFLDWLKDHHTYSSILRPGIALQGLCGLQLQEALRLTIPKVNLEAGTITIEGKVKNRWRVRRIPIPEMVGGILRDAIETATDGDERIVRHGGRDWKAYSSLLEGALDQWAGGRRPIPPKDLRNTLPTEATNGGWAGYFVNRYLGHSPQSMAERHYHGEVSKCGQNLEDLLREKVVRRVDFLIENCTTLHDVRGKVVNLHAR